MDYFFNRKKRGVCPSCSNQMIIPNNFPATLIAESNGGVIEYAIYVCDKCGAKWKEQNEI